MSGRLRVLRTRSGRVVALVPATSVHRVGERRWEQLQAALLREPFGRETIESAAAEDRDWLGKAAFVDLGPTPSLGRPLLDHTSRRESTEAIPRLSALARARAANHWIDLRCVGPWGSSLAGTTVQITLPDGTKSYRLDPDSRLYLEHLRDGGRFVLAIPADARAGSMIPLPERGTMRNAVRTQAGASLELAVDQAHVVLVEEPHAFSC